LNSRSLFLKDALSCRYATAEGGQQAANLPCSREKEQGASCGRHPASLSSLGY